MLWMTKWMCCMRDWSVLPVQMMRPTPLVLQEDLEAANDRLQQNNSLLEHETDKLRHALQASSGDQERAAAVHCMHRLVRHSSAASSRAS